MPMCLKELKEFICLIKLNFVRLKIFQCHLKIHNFKASHFVIYYTIYRKHVLTLSKFMKVYGRNKEILS